MKAVNKPLLIISILLFVFLLFSIVSGVNKSKEYASLRRDYVVLEADYDNLTDSRSENVRSSLLDENERLKTELNTLSEQLKEFSEIADKQAHAKKLDEEISDKQEKLDSLNEELEPLEVDEQRRLTEGTTVYEDKIVKINYLKTQIDARYSGYNDTIVFLVENKTDVVLTIRYKTLAFDGVEVENCMGSDDISPQSRGKLNIIAMNLSNRFPTYISGTIQIEDDTETVIKTPYSPGSSIYKDYYEITFINTRVK